ncbi:MAG: RNA polymerase factor sigma-54 [Alphaproteobacteria bacterium]|nr:RNA polymerase factor sigma-54 [Alphaproteobacteria bacterium]
MALTPRLDLRQTTSLVMTPQLQQAIKLLQMSNFELSEYVELELEQNPLLERDEQEQAEGGDDAARSNGAEDGAVDEAQDPALPPDSLDLANADSMPADGDAPLDTSYENHWDGDNSGGFDDNPLRFDATRVASGGRIDFSDGESSVEATLSSELTLRDHLLEQLNVDITDPGDRLIGLHLITMLDEAGRLAGDLSDVAARLGSPLDRVEDVLDRMQRFDPPGIFARDLKECFAIQLRELDRLDPAMQRMLDNLHLFEKYDLAKLRRTCGVDEEDFAGMLAEIRSLQPKPGTLYEHEIAQPVVPDVLMRPQADGGWRVELNSETLPRVLVNRHYYADIARGTRDKEAKEYLSERLNSASWLVKALHQRATTILKVAAEIVRQQDGFFEYGVTHMRPLILRDIAEIIDMHESTVSRVTSNKYMATPRGIFELKYFFSAALASADGGSAHSAEAVRHRIKELCDAEPPGAILSDDDIADHLREEGIDIARRTVAKYREAINIPSSVKRRRIKSGRR